MRLVRFGARGSEKPGLIDAQGVVRDLSAVVPDIDARTLSPAALARLREIDPATLPAVPAGVRLGACVGSIPNLVCIGLNYSDHAAETNTPIPSGSRAALESRVSATRSIGFRDHAGAHRLTSSGHDLDSRQMRRTVGGLAHLRHQSCGKRASRHRAPMVSSS